MEKIKISQNGQWNLQKSQNEDLNKSPVIPAAMAAMLSGTPFADTATPHPDLEHIGFLETSSGKNKAHKMVDYGLNTGHTAAGTYGLMPITIQETVKKNPELKEKYGHLSSMHPDTITSYINQDANADTEIANAHWNRLGRLFPQDEARKAYAWKNGIAGAFRASDEQVANHPYVRAYMQKKYSQRNVASQPLP